MDRYEREELITRFENEKQELLRRANERSQRLEDQLGQQAELLEMLMKEPEKVGLVLSRVGTDKVEMYVNGEIFVIDSTCSTPEGEAFTISPGERWLINSKIVPSKKVAYRDTSGFEAVCLDVGKGYCELDAGGRSAFVKVTPGLSVEKGDRVLIDQAARLVLSVLPKREDGTKVTYTGISWSDIGGQEEAKAALIEAIEMPVRYSDLYAKYGKSAIKGVLLYGPPGCGKTMLGKAAATSIASMAGSADGGFIYVKGPEVLDKFVGEAERKIRALFEQGRQYYARTGFPAILFIDESESIVPRRGSGISSDIDRTIVPTFLSEMDGMDDNATIVILATNRVDTIDNAVLREGRIDRKVKIDRPGVDTTREIFAIHMAKTPLGNGDTRHTMAQFAAQEMFGDKYALAVADMHDGSKIRIPLYAAISGAMIASVVDRATTRAIHRELSGSDISGVMKADLEQSVHDVYKANIDVDHNDVIKDFLQDRVQHVVGVRRA
jgi:proteasome-associated ATPase